MLKRYSKNLKGNFPDKYGDSYHCHFALKDLVNNLITINYVGLIDFKPNSSGMTVTIDRGYYFRLPFPVTEMCLKKFSTSMYKFTTVREITLYKVLLENTSLTKLKNDHCTRCGRADTCKAFFMSCVKPH